MGAEHRCLLALVSDVKTESALDGLQVAELAHSSFRGASATVLFQLIEAESCIAGRTGCFAFRAAKSMRSPILAHDFGRAAATLAFVEVLIDILVLAVGNDVSSQQMALAFVVTSLVFVRTAHLQRVDHIFDEQSRRLEVGELDRSPAARTPFAYGAACELVFYLLRRRVIRECSGDALLAERMRADIGRERI